MVEVLIEIEDRFTVQEVVDILGIEKEIAQCLLDGLFEWEDEEIAKLAQSAGISAEQLTY